MSSPVKVYDVKVSGLWTTRQEIREGEKRLGVLTNHRRWYGAVDRCVYHPEKGSVLEFRREPGVLRGQFSLWAPETHEWLGSTTRHAFLKREIEISTGGKPYRLLPSTGFGRGWIVNAPKTGTVAELHVSPFGRSVRIDVHRRLDYMLVLMAYALASQVLSESWLPGPPDRSVRASAQGPAKA